MNRFSLGNPNHTQHFVICSTLNIFSYLNRNRHVRAVPVFQFKSNICGEFPMRFQANSIDLHWNFFLIRSICRLHLILFHPGGLPYTRTTVPIKLELHRLRGKRYCAPFENGIWTRKKEVTVRGTRTASCDLSVDQKWKLRRQIQRKQLKPFTAFT